MITQDKCFYDFSTAQTFLASAYYFKIQQYLITNGLLPVDDPITNTLETSILAATGFNVHITLTLDLTKFNGYMPFNQGDLIYIYGAVGNLNGVTYTGIENAINTANTVYSVYPSAPNKTPNQITISSGQVSPAANLLFGNCIWTSGGSIRIATLNTETVVFSAYIRNVVQPTSITSPEYQMMTWPRSAITLKQAYNVYSEYYIDYMKWTLMFETTSCNSISISGGTNYTSGLATVSGGSGIGMQLQLTVNTFGSTTLIIANITNMGTGYNNGDYLTILQSGSQNDAIGLLSTINCNKQSSSQAFITLSSSITSANLLSIINLAVSSDPTINTIVIETNSTIKNPENYTSPNIRIAFLTTNVSDNPEVSVSNNGIGFITSQSVSYYPTTAPVGPFTWSTYYPKFNTLGGGNIPISNADTTPSSCGSVDNWPIGSIQNYFSKINDIADQVIFICTNSTIQPYLFPLTTSGGQFTCNGPVNLC